jgi:flagellar basal-body rod modification protein FlgD
METATINGSTSSAATSSSDTTAKKDLDKNAFLSLLVAQLKNQDPTSSQDPNAMVQQMTSFSSLEQMQNMSSALLGIQSQNTAIFQAQSAGLIGKQVQVPSSTFSLQDGSATLGVQLEAGAKVTVQIKDATGNVIRTIDGGSMGAGENKLVWDGKNASGQAMPSGSYTVAVTALDDSGAKVGASTSTFVRVDSVNFAGGTVSVIAGGRTFSLSEIAQVSA